MSKKLIVSIDAAKDHPDLRVQDVFMHVIDLFQLINESDPGAEGEIEWKLVKASMNSPFTVIAEAVAAKPGVRVDSVAIRQRRAFRSAMSELAKGQVPRVWGTPKAKAAVKNVMARNRNGIGLTKIDYGLKSEKPIVITRFDAEKSLPVLVADALVGRLTKPQIGSIEGRLTQIATHYHRPAILVVERKTGEEVWCIVPDEFMHEISEQTSVEDVWKESRVVVRGKIFYEKNGTFDKVEATNVRRVEPRQVSEESITDRNFTGGLTVSEYLEKLRAGTLG